MTRPTPQKGGRPTRSLQRSDSRCNL
jgi:hypothetical protein